MKTEPLKKMLSFIMLSSMLALTACSSGAEASESEKFLPEAQNDTIVTSVGGGSNADDNAESSLRVSFIDVGQGDSEFIELPNGETLLIDAGTNETGADVVSYISSLGYTSIDYVVGTHPHVVQDTARIDGKPVIYSTGNAVSNMSAINTWLGMAVTLRFVHDLRSGEKKLLEPELTFTWCCLPGMLDDGYSTIIIKEWACRRDDWLTPSDFDNMVSTLGRVRAATGISGQLAGL